MSETKPIEGITLKHLAPYLPYGLKAVDEKNNIIEVYGINSYSNFIQNIFAEETLHFQQFKLLLRPLSDLTKEIEVNGESFVPFVKYAKQFGAADDYLFENMNDEKGEMHWTVCDSLPKYVFEWLVSIHFDVFGLLDKGLAININDIQK